MAKLRQEKKPLTDEEKYEQDLQLERDLARSARTYTILERNRNQFSTGKGGGAVARQKRVIDIFHNEQKEILTDLNVASAPARKKEDDRNSCELTQLLKISDDFDAQIKQLKINLEEVNGQIKMVKLNILEISKQQITDEKFYERNVKGNKILQTEENRLEMQTKKFCAINSKNRLLREEIQHLLKEREKFNKIWNKLIRNLVLGKKFMMDLIEQATIAYDQREEWVSKLQFLRKKAHNDLLCHISEMRVLERKLDNDRKLKEFFEIKGQKRYLRDLEAKEKEKRAQERQNREKKMERYLEILCKIMEFTGEDHVSEVAQQFLAQEEENFSMFRYVNNLDKEVEELTESLEKLHKEIDENQALHEMRRLRQENNLAALHENVDRLEKEVASKTDELKALDNKLAVIMKGIGDLFKLFKCSNDPLMQLLGENDTINTYSVLLYLEILDRTIQEYLISNYDNEKQLVSKKKMQRNNVTIPEVKSPLIIDPLETFVHSNPCPLCVENEQVNDVIDDLQYALSREQVQQKLIEIDRTKGLSSRVHNVSACHLPKSRQIIQKRYQ